MSEHLKSVPRVIKRFNTSYQNNGIANISGSRRSIMGKPVHNWAEMFEIDQDNFRYPETIQDVICLVNSTN